MASRVYFALVLSLVVTIAAAGQEEQKSKEEHVLTLDHSNFTDTIKKHDFIVVEFYAPWCGHCVKLAPEYEKAASVLSSHDPPLVLAKVDADDESNKKLSKEYGVGGFPTIKIIRNGGKSIQDYKGPREADGIVSYVKKQSGPASVEIKSKEDASNLIDNSIALVGVFPEFSGEEFNNFTALADKLRSEYDFGHTLDAKLLPHGEPASGSFIRLFKPFDELFVDCQDFHEEAVEKFIESSTIPILTVYDKDPVNQRLAGKFFRTPNSKAMMWINFSDPVADSLKSKFREVAEKNKGERISFLLGDTELVQHAPEHFGVNKEDVPFIVIQSEDGKKYVKANVEPDLIANWVKQYKDGKVSPYVKSEPIPETNNEPVKVVVHDSIEDMVINSEKNVLLEFYAPWCGHCKELAPILEEVAVSYQHDSDILIAKLDAIANDVPNTFEVEGFPTLYFKSTSGKLVLFDGERTKEGIIDFIEKNREKTSKKDLPKDEL